MSINDAICCGAEPLFFLDYVAMSRDDPPLLEKIVQGISDGCLQADCALLGGETAIMPDLYRRGEYDLAGFCVGVVEKKSVIDGAAVTAGDVILGVASSGLHSNGYSLVRKVVFEMAQLAIDDHIDDLGATVGEELLQPTRIYARPLRKVIQYYKERNVIHGAAHITGGGLLENLQRITPRGLRLKLHQDSWPAPPVFPWLQKLGAIDDAEMQRVFNMGIGLTLIFSPYFANTIQTMLADAGLESWLIGAVETMA